MSDLLELANAANEAALAYRAAVDDGYTNWITVLDRANELVAAVDRLTGAVVEAANDAPVVLRREDLTRIAEVEDVAFGLGKTVPEAIVWLVNERLSGSFHDGYNAAIEEHNHPSPTRLVVPEDERVVKVTRFEQLADRTPLRAGTEVHIGGEVLDALLDDDAFGPQS